MPRGIYKRTERHLKHLRKIAKAQRKNYNIKEKYCSKCQQTKPIDKFYKRKPPYKRPSDKYSSHCKKCIFAYNKIYKTKWRKENKEYINWYKRKRELKKKISGNNHTYGEWETLKAQYNWTCPSCRKREPEIKLTEDHIIPLSKGGSDNIKNIQPLCGSCNCKKFTTVIFYKKGD